MAEVPRVYSTGKKQSTVFSYYEGRAGYRGHIMSMKSIVLNLISPRVRWMH